MWGRYGPSWTKNVFSTLSKLEMKVIKWHCFLSKKYRPGVVDGEGAKYGRQSGGVARGWGARE